MIFWYKQLHPVCFQCNFLLLNIHGANIYNICDILICVWPFPKEFGILILLTRVVSWLVVALGLHPWLNTNSSIPYHIIWMIYISLTSTLYRVVAFWCLPQKPCIYWFLVAVINATWLCGIASCNVFFYVVFLWWWWYDLYSSIFYAVWIRVYWGKCRLGIFHMIVTFATRIVKMYSYCCQKKKYLEFMSWCCSKEIKN